MENKLEIAKKWLDENSKEMEAFQKLVSYIDKTQGIPDYHNLASKMLPIFVRAFGICVRDSFSFKRITIASLLTDPSRAINAYNLFNEYLGAVEYALGYDTDSEIDISCWPTDINNFKVSLQYLRENATEEEIVEYLD